jgi:hypothetical protein
MELRTENMRKESKNLVICPQNINSLNNKKDELIISLQDNLITPHFICISEHHLRKQEILQFSLTGYKLASSFCRE